MDELKRYLCKSAKDRIILGVIGIILGAICAYAVINHVGLFVEIIPGVMCLILLWAALASGRQDRAALNRLDEEGILEEAAGDFQLADRFCGGEVMLGNKYIFRHKQTELIRFSDIVSAQYVVRMGDIGNEESAGDAPEEKIFLRLTNGKNRELCSLYGADSLAQAQAIYAALKGRNPNIQTDL